MRVLAYLLVHQWKGAVLNVARSGPRLLIGLVTVAYIGAQLFNLLFYLIRQPDQQVRLESVSPAILQGGLLFALAIPAFMILHQGFQGRLVAFNAGDIDFLFSMPLAQRLVLGFRLAIDTVQLFGMTLVGSIWVSPILARLFHVSIFDVLWRLLLSIPLCLVFLLTVSHGLYIFYSHRIRASAVLTLASRIMTTAAGVVLLVVLYGDVSRGITPWEQAVRFFTHPVVRTALLPLSLTADIIMSPHPRFPDETGRNLACLFTLAFLGVVSVLAQKRNMYEPSLPASFRRIRFREALRSGGVAAVQLELLRERTTTDGPGGLRAPHLGQGAWGLLWKNLQIAARYPWLKLVVGLFATIGIPLLLRIYLRVEDHDTIRFLSLPAWTYLAWISSLIVFHSVRNELAQGEFLKTAPLPAWRIVMFFVFWPVVAYTAALWGFILSIGVLFAEVYQPLLLPMALVLPMVMLSLSLFHATVAVLYPRRKDPLHRLLSGVFLVPGWTVLLLPLGIVVAISRMINMSGNRGAEFAVNVAISLLLAATYAGISGICLWLGTMAFRNYSPSDD